MCQSSLLFYVSVAHQVEIGGNYFLSISEIFSSTNDLKFQLQRKIVPYYITRSRSVD